MSEFINIGPECFSDADETVICWKGRNYYAQSEVESLREQVQAVRDVLADYVPFPDSLTVEVLRALDGDDDD